MNIVAILGSPSEVSRSASLLALAQARLNGVASQSRRISVRDLPAQALLHAELGDPQIRQAIDLVGDADVVLVATPIYKAAYSGVLKAFLDLLPQDALRGKTVLPLATGGSVAHLLALEYALKPVLAALGARDILDPVFASDAQIVKDASGAYHPLPDVAARIDTVVAPVIERAEEFERSEAAARERDELIARLQPHLQALPDPRSSPIQSPTRNTAS